MADFKFRNEGSLWLCIPQNPAAEEHLRANVSEDAQWWGYGSLVVEPRYVDTLASALIEAGFEVEGA